MRDHRSLSEKYESAETAFRLLEEEANRTGEKVVSVKAVAEAAKIDRGYLYGKGLNENELRKMFINLGKKISGYKKQFSQDNRNDGSGKAKCVEDLDTAIKQNATLIARRNEIESSFNQVVKQRDQAQNSLNKAEAEIVKLQAKVGIISNVVPINKSTKNHQQAPVIISPDNFLTLNGQYVGHDNYQRKVAWTEAVEKLSEELKIQETTTLYISIGIPGAGKTRWAETLICSGRTIVFDATNLTMSDRYDLFWTVKQSNHKNIKMVAVSFPVGLEIAKKQNKKRNSDRCIPDEVIYDASKRIEFPSLEGAFSGEDFDEILIIKRQV